MKNKLIRIALIGSLLTSSSLLANDSFIDSVGINLGKSYSDFSQKDTSGAILLGNEPNKSFNSIEVYATLNPILEFCKENNIKPIVSYTYSKNSELEHYYLLVGMNKYFSLQNFTPYVGVVVGYGELNWEYDPLNNSQSKNVDANSFIGGVQVGTNYKFNENWALNLNAKYLFHNYETNLKTSNASATIEHDSTATISLGLQYSF